MREYKNSLYFTLEYGLLIFMIELLLISRAFTSYRNTSPRRIIVMHLDRGKKSFSEGKKDNVQSVYS